MRKQIGKQLSLKLKSALLGKNTLKQTMHPYLPWLRLATCGMANIETNTKANPSCHTEVDGCKKVAQLEFCISEKTRNPSCAHKQLEALVVNFLRYI